MRITRFFVPINIQTFVEHIRGTRACRTAAAYERTAQAFLMFLGKRQVCPAQMDVELFLVRKTMRTHSRASATRNHELACIRALARFLKKQGAWENDPTVDIPFVKESRKDPTFLMRNELGKLFEVAANHEDVTHRARNLAIVALLSQLGLRVHELVALNVPQVDIASSTLLGVCGKGATRVDLPMSEDVASIVARWIPVRASLADPSERSLFITKRTGKRMSIRSVQRLIAALWSKCSSVKKITPHSLRHTAATLSITLGIDISAVGDLLRHSSLDITRKYIGLVGARRRAAVEKLAVTIPREVIPRRQGEPRSVDRSEIPWNVLGLDILGPPPNSIDVQESLCDVHEQCRGIALSTAPDRRDPMNESVQSTRPNTGAFSIDWHICMSALASRCPVLLCVIIPIFLSSCTENSSSSDLTGSGGNSIAGGTSPNAEQGGNESSATGSSSGGFSVDTSYASGGHAVISSQQGGSPSTSGSSQLLACMSQSIACTTSATCCPNLSCQGGYCLPNLVVNAGGSSSVGTNATGNASAISTGGTWTTGGYSSTKSLSLALFGGSSATGETYATGGVTASVGGASSGGSNLGGVQNTSSSGGLPGTSTAPIVDCKPPPAAGIYPLTCKYNGSACVTCPTDCCTGYAVDSICQNCTTAGKACTTPDCVDCCSHQSVAGVCIDCTSNGECTCPTACHDNKCVKTPDGTACAYANCSDCDSGKSANSTCTPQCSTDADCGTTQNCRSGRCIMQVALGSGGGMPVAASGGSNALATSGGSGGAS